MIEKDDLLHLIPQRDVREMRGFLKSLEVADVRDEEDRF